MNVPGADAGSSVTGCVFNGSPSTWKGIKITKHRDVFNMTVNILPFKTQVFELSFLHGSEGLYRFIYVCHRQKDSFCFSELIMLEVILK